jgi:hypothetical protein
MRSMKYTDGWTRRHFLEQTAKGIFAAGVLSPLIDVIGGDGNCEAAYPPELLSIELYTKGKLKTGDVLNAENVDIVKDLLDPAAYWQIKHDGRLVGPRTHRDRSDPDDAAAIFEGDARQPRQAQDLS